MEALLEAARRARDARRDGWLLLPQLPPQQGLRRAGSGAGGGASSGAGGGAEGGGGGMPGAHNATRELRSAFAGWRSEAVALCA